MKILVEGFDCVGKTTLCRALAPELDDACVLSNPSHEGVVGKLIRSIQDTKPLLPEAMMHLYVAEQLLIEDDLKVIYPNVRKYVILDRHAMTSGPAYRPEPWSVLWPILNLSGTFQKPDLGVVLTASPDEILRRLEETKHPIHWDAAGIRAISERLTHMVQRFAKRTIVLDAEALTTMQLVAEVRRVAVPV